MEERTKARFVTGHVRDNVHALAEVRHWPSACRAGISGGATSHRDEDSEIDSIE